jgi:hypothetical protein
VVHGNEKVAADTWLKSALFWSALFRSCKGNQGISSLEVTPQVFLPISNLLSSNFYEELT